MPEEFGSSLGGTEDLVALLKQKQLQSPQQNMQGFLGGEREGTQVEGGVSSLPEQMVNEIARIQQNMNQNDPNRHALEAVLDNITNFMGQTQRDRNGLAAEAFNKADNNFRGEPLAVDKTNIMKQLGFE